MSTRCQTGFEGGDVLVYRHSDGYPTSQLPLLSRFVNTFMKSRGFDSEYMAARLCAAIARVWGTVGPEGQSKSQSKSEYKYGEFLSLGVDTKFHDDIEWFYFVKKNGDIEVYAASMWDHSGRPYTGRAPSAGARLVGTLTANSSVAVAKKAAEKAEADDRA